MYLMEKGANIDSLDGNGWSPLHMAVSHNRLKIVKANQTSWTVFQHIRRIHTSQRFFAISYDPESISQSKRNRLYFKDPYGWCSWDTGLSSNCVSIVAGYIIPCTDIRWISTSYTALVFASTKQLRGKLNDTRKLQIGSRNFIGESLASTTRILFKCHRINSVNRIVVWECLINDWIQFESNT